MNKRLIIASLLILTKSALFGANGAQMGQLNTANQAQVIYVNQPTANQLATFGAARANAINQPIAGQLISQNALTLNQIQQAYVAQSTNFLKEAYIDSILAVNTNYTLQENIIHAQYLAQVVNNDLSLHTGWLYNNNQAQVDWLRIQKLKIARRISDLQWQAKHWTERALRYAALGVGGSFAALLAYYLLQDQYGKKIDPNYKIQEFGDVAWMPIQGAINVGQAAVVPAKYVAAGAYQVGAQAVGAGKVVGNFAIQGGQAIGNKGGQLAQQGIHNAAEYVFNATKPSTSSQPATPEAQPTASTSWSEWLFGTNQNSSPQSTNTTTSKAQSATNRSWFSWPSYTDAEYNEAIQDNDPQSTTPIVQPVTSQSTSPVVQSTPSVNLPSVTPTQTTEDSSPAPTIGAHQNNISTQTPLELSRARFNTHITKQNSGTNNQFKSPMDTTPSEMLQGIKSTTQDFATSIGKGALAVETDFHNWLHNLPAEPNYQDKYEDYFKELMNQHSLQ